jgi:hypothetical protein
MTYKLLLTASERLVKLHFDDFTQTMNRDEFAAYMRPFRDSDPDFYAELVHIYVLMCKPLPHQAGRNL